MAETRPTAHSKRIPQVDKVLRHPILLARQKEIRHEVLAEVTRRRLADYRSDESNEELTLDEIATQIETRLQRLLAGSLRRVINGTGIILSTNLGRAPLPEAAIAKAHDVLSGYSNLELDMDSGKRGERTNAMEELLSVLTGCESAILLNNNAAAVMLAVNSLARDKEVIVSRSELIEIGGSFRLPDVIESAGGKLREVGTTNRTRISDYDNAISQRTGLLLKCHRSNFEITGFTEEVTTQALVELGQKKTIAVIEDLGSGALVDFSKLGMKYEPTVAEVITTGVDLVLFSADKLMGGSQAGIACGKKHYVKALRSNPIYRALRADKLSVALIEQVLVQYLKNDPQNHLPVMQMAISSLDHMKKRVESFIVQANKLSTSWQFEIAQTNSAFGGGTLPGQTLPSFGLAVRQNNSSAKRISADKLMGLLRQASTPVVAIIQDGNVVIDFRTISQQDEELLLQSLKDLPAL